MGKQKTMTLYERALEEGEKKNKLETARKMQVERFNPEQIIKITGLSKEELRENGIL
jgi:predicted transposase/invertase (TIGR01784 family)